MWVCKRLSWILECSLYNASLRLETQWRDNADQKKNTPFYITWTSRSSKLQLLQLTALKNKEQRVVGRIHTSPYILLHLHFMHQNCKKKLLTVLPPPHTCTRIWIYRTSDWGSARTKSVVGKKLSIRAAEIRVWKCVDKSNNHWLYKVRTKTIVRRVEEF